MLTLDRERLAWAAGLFEGEGCVTSSVTRYGVRRICLSLTSTDCDVVERFRATVSLGRIYGPFSNPKKPHHKPYWMWQTTTFEHAQAALSMLWRGLCSRRRARSVEMFQKFYATERAPRTRKPGIGIPEERVRRVQTLKSLGLSNREIAWLVQLSKTSVQRASTARVSL